MLSPSSVAHTQTAEAPAPLAKERPATPTVLCGIGTALPPFWADQQTACRFMERVLEASHPAAQMREALPRLRRLYQRSGIARRYSCVGDYVEQDAECFVFFPPAWSLEPFPTTAQRMKHYEQQSLPLAERAALQALQSAQIAPEEVTHLLVSTCTGFFAPGLDILLARRLGLASSVARTALGFMGCYAGLSGVRVADEIVRADARAVVLQVAVELCSLHFQKDLTPDTLVANCLFADGASAAVYARAGRCGGQLAEVLATHSHFTPESLGAMSWHVGDTGFVMRLDAAVPELLGESVPGFVGELRQRARLSSGTPCAWAIHPGGRKIVEALQQVLELADEDVECSTSVLRDFGNMSSATVLFVLQRELAREGACGEAVVTLAFGPGLTTEGAVLARLS